VEIEAGVADDLESSDSVTCEEFGTLECSLHGSDSRLLLLEVVSLVDGGSSCTTGGGGGFQSGRGGRGCEKDDPRVC